MESRKSESLRTVDVARRSGYSVQQIRNLEHDGVLPPAPRGAAGYRHYTAAHLHAAAAYRALAAGTGPVEAKRIMRAMCGGETSRALALLDAAHSRLDVQRREVTLAKEAAALITAEPLADVRSGDAMTVSQLADALGVPASTLRYWDTAGLVVPRRGPTSNRRYMPVDVRDARMVHQLRQAGYGVPRLRELLPRLPHSDEISTILDDRDKSIETRSAALLSAAAELHNLLNGCFHGESAGLPAR